MDGTGNYSQGLGVSITDLIEGDGIDRENPKSCHASIIDRCLKDGTLDACTSIFSKRQLYLTFSSEIEALEVLKSMRSTSACISSVKPPRMVFGRYFASPPKWFVMDEEGRLFSVNSAKGVAFVSLGEFILSPNIHQHPNAQKWIDEAQ